MRHSPWALRSAVCLLVAAASAGALADPPGRVGRLADAQGTVWMFDPSSNEWVAAERNHPITTGDRLATDNNAQAVVRIGSTTVFVGNGTEVTFPEVDDARMRVEVDNGSIAAEAREAQSASQLSLETPEGAFFPGGPGEFRVDRNAAPNTEPETIGSALNAPMHFQSSDSELDLQPGQAGEFWREGNATHYTWVGIPQDAFGQWIASAGQPRPQGPSERYVSPEMTGAEDLDAYGQWQSAPDYGPVWVPQVAVGWAPYRYGHWGFVAPWGWTWIDDAPWGFAPFHYGRWTQWHDRWCWVPGRYAAQPVYAPALVGWVGGSGISVDIHIGGPAVGWVPLAPREAFYPTYAVNVEHWQRMNPYAPVSAYHLPPPDRHIAFANRGLPNGVTVVSADVISHHRPVAAAAPHIDPRVAASIALHEGKNLQAFHPMAPPPAPPHAVTAAAVAHAAIPAPPLHRTVAEVHPPVVHGPAAAARPGAPRESAVPPAPGARPEGRARIPERAPQAEVHPAPGVRPETRGVPERAPQAEARPVTPPAAVHPAPEAARAVPPPPNRRTEPVEPRGEHPAAVPQPAHEAPAQHPAPQAHEPNRQPLPEPVREQEAHRQAPQHEAPAARPPEPRAVEQHAPEQRAPEQRAPEQHAQPARQAEPAHQEHPSNGHDERNNDR